MNNGAEKKFYGRTIDSLTKDEWIEVMQIIAPKVGSIITFEQLLKGIEKQLALGKGKGYVPDVVKGIVWEDTHFSLTKDRKAQRVQ